MRIDISQIQDRNEACLVDHRDRYDFLASILSKKGYKINSIVKKLSDFQVAIPSWALGAGGTRFGRFGFKGSQPI